MKNNNLQEKALIRKVFSSEIAQVITIIGVVWIFITLVILPIQKNTQDISYIEGNHLKTIEEAIIEIKQELKSNSIVHSEILKELGVIEGKLAK